MESTGRSSLAEFIGSFAVVFIGAGSVIVATNGLAGANIVGVALANGLVLAAMISAIAHISGGPINPAVTIALWVAGKLESGRAAAYVIAEVAGGVAGALLLALVLPGNLFDQAFGGATLVAAGVGTGKAVLIEATLTFFWVFVVFGTAVDDRSPLEQSSGLAIGLVLAFGILVAGPFTGGSMNPARSFGPALVSGTWTDWWVYWVGPVAGGVVASVVYWGTFLRQREEAAE